MKQILSRIGLTGITAIVVLVAALAFSSLVVTPLEERVGRLASHKAPAAAQRGGEKVAAVHQFLKQDQELTDWLAKLHGIGVATGVQLKSASYRTLPVEGSRIVRYEIVLPAAGSYGQIRDFLKRALAEIPVMSLDSLALKRSEHAIQAEMRLTLHMVKS
jgi:hypothetical protein